MATRIQLCGVLVVEGWSSSSPVQGQLRTLVLVCKESLSTIFWHILILSCQPQGGAREKITKVIGIHHLGIMNVHEFYSNHPIVVEIFQRVCMAKKNSQGLRALLKGTSAVVMSEIIAFVFLTLIKWFISYVAVSTLHISLYGNDHTEGDRSLQSWCLVLHYVCMQDF